MDVEEAKTKLAKILKDIKFDFYIASPTNDIITHILDYPNVLFSANYIMKKNKEIKPKMVKKISHYKNLMLDSGITNPDITNEDVLKLAEVVHPNIIVPKDYFGDAKGTLKSIHEFLDLYYSYSVEGDLLFPLQDPWNIDKSLMEYDYFAIGGIIKKTGDQKRAVIRKIVNKYPDKKFHLFGAGLGSFGALIHKHKNIVSSDTDFDRAGGINRAMNFKSSGDHFTIVADFCIMIEILDNIVKYYNYGKNEDEFKQTTLF